MKSILHVSILVVALATATAFAHGDEDHNPSAKHVGHAALIGVPGVAAKVSRTIQIEASDSMRFTPANIRVKRGETIRFVVKNTGKLKHEMVLGTGKALKEHAALMLQFPEMEHSDPNQVSVEPGKTGEIVWKFTKAGKFDFACLQPGHFAAGMVGKVAVK